MILDWRDRSTHYRIRHPASQSPGDPDALSLPGRVQARESGQYSGCWAPIWAGGRAVKSWQSFADKPQRRPDGRRCLYLDTGGFGFKSYKGIFIVYSSAYRLNIYFVLILLEIKNFLWNQNPIHEHHAIVID